ncbi:MAG: beta-eliminating lyase-related protein [Pseudomonadota bacterium]
MAEFVSDNVSGIHPKVMKALQDANTGYRRPYGNDELSDRLNGVFSTLFETEVFVLPCVTGTAANSLALSLMAGPINSICVHERSHVYMDECNAPELFSGARLLPLPGDYSKLNTQSLQTVVSEIGELHSPQPSAISLTQTTETGTIYSLDEIAAIAEFACFYKMKMHMDGARFANAVASIGCSPADMTWRAGLDALSFGATKNGCLAAEAVVIFNQDFIPEARHRLKRSAQLLSKQRFLAAQLLAYVEDDLWLNSASHANSQMAKLANRLAEVEGVELPDSIGSNMMFAKFTAEQNQRLEAAGLAGYLFETGHMRLVCSWATHDEEIDRFVAAVTG